MLGTVYTGFGYWDVWSWAAFFAIAAALVLWLRAQGREDYKEGTDQDEIYWSGNIVPEEERISPCRPRRRTGDSERPWRPSTRS